MNLLLIINSVEANGTNGSEIFCHEILRELRASHQVTVISRSALPQGVQRTDIGFEVGDDVVLDPDSLTEFLGGEIPIEQFDLVYNFGGLQFGNTIVSFLRALYGEISLVNHFQAILSQYASREGLGEETRLFNEEGQREAATGALMNVFLSQSEYGHSVAEDLGEGLVSVVPAGVRTRLIDGVEADRSFLPELAEQDPATTVFLTAGRFQDYVKGADLVYRAFATLAQQRSDVCLLIVSSSNRFVELLADTPSESWRMVKWLERGPFLRTMAAADVVIVPSRYESFGLLAVEAMMLGKPVIVNAVGGLREIVCHGKMGLCNEVRNGSFGLYQAMKALADNPAGRKMMGRVGQEHALQEFSLDRVVSLIEKGLEAAMQR